MRKLISVLLAVFMALLLCTACACDKLEYNGNLGYDFNNVKNKEITFNAYHSNTKDGSWEQLVRLYPISNRGDVATLEDVTLDKPYDKDGVLGNLDNILITVVMKR